MTPAQFTKSELPNPALIAPETATHRLWLSIQDLAMGIQGWRLWLVLGMNDIHQRYRRSRIGQFWITLSMATTIIALGIVYSYLFHLPISQYLPYLAVSFIVWGLISSIILESSAVFTSADGYLRQAPIAKSVFVHRMLVRNLVVLAHNLVILPPLYIYFDVPISWSLPLALVGIILVILNGIWVGLFLGTLCARFRDLPQIMASVMQIAFFVTPVMWRPTQLDKPVAWLTVFNPFTHFLAVIREPLLGQIPSFLAWKITGAVTVIGYLITLPFFARFRARIVYWL